MGYIKEPEGVDFTVSGAGLSATEKKTLSAYIQQVKEKRTKRLRKTVSAKKKTA